MAKGGPILHYRVFVGMDIFFAFVYSLALFGKRWYQNGVSKDSEEDIKHFSNAKQVVEIDYAEEFGGSLLEDTVG